MATQPTTGLTYEDLANFPNDNLRRELIDGELVVTPSPSTRHQHAVTALTWAFYEYCRSNGGRVFPAPLDVFFSDANVVEPDVLFVGAEHVARVEQKFVRGAPDIVVEVSSPSTRRLELFRKRDLYERFGVAEYWYVDLQSDRVEIYRLREGRYDQPELRGRGAVLDSERAPGFEVPVAEVLGEPVDDPVAG